MSWYPITWFLIIPKEILNLEKSQIIYVYSGMTYNKRFLFNHGRYFIYQNKDDFDLKPYLDQVKTYVLNNL